MTDYKLLADEIRQAFTPYAFKCECDSADCANVREDEATQIRYYQMLAIANFIEKKGN